MEEKISYVVFEGQMARNERLVKRLIVVIIILVAMVFASNAIWLYAWNQYEYVSEDTSFTYDYMQDGRGINIIGNLNEVTNESETEDKADNIDKEQEEDER